VSSHFYDSKTGELIEGGLREARKRAALPSPTTVLGILGSYGLKLYFRKMMFEATATTPRLPGQSDDDYFEKCCIAADEHGQAARDKGGDFHTLIQRFHQRCMSHEPHCASDGICAAELAPQFDAYVSWYKKNVRRTLMVEEAVIGQGYAGRVDHVAEMMTGKRACIDAKTQDTTKKKGKFTYYSNWGVQLGAYAGAIQPIPDVLISVAVSSQAGAPFVEAYQWPKEPAYYHNIFLGLLDYWKEDNDYHPTPM
jgi:hypothetical protein